MNSYFIFAIVLTVAYIIYYAVIIALSLIHIFRQADRVFRTRIRNLSPE